MMDIILDQLNIQELPHSKFWEGFVFNFILCWVYFFISLFVSPYIWGKIDKKDHYYWHITIPALFNPLVVGPAVFGDVVAAYDWVQTNLGNNPLVTYKPTTQIWYATGCSVGYMFCDTVFMVVFYKKLRPSFNTQMWYQMWVHHVASIFLWPYALMSHVAVLPVLYYVFTEVTSLIMNIRFMWKFAVGEGVMLKAWESVLALSFLFIRRIPIPFFFYAFYMVPGQYRLMTYFQIFICLGFLWIPFFLNLVWFRLMVQKIISVLCPGLCPKKKKKEDKKKA